MISNITMDILKMNKIELLEKCKKLGITKYSSKNKLQLIELINLKQSIENNKIIFPIDVLSKTDYKIINYIDLCCGIGGFRIALENFEKKNIKFPISKFGFFINTFCSNSKYLFIP